MTSTSEPYWVYILLCENGAYYTGCTQDLARRYRQHQRGQGGKYTRSFRPLRIARCWRVAGGRSAALKVESFIKRRSRRKKEELIARPQALAAALRAAAGFEMEISVGARCQPPADTNAKPPTPGPRTARTT